MSTLPVSSSGPTGTEFKINDDTFESTIHVKLDFELYQNGEQKFPSSDQMQAIMALFPTCFKVTASPPFLVVRCETLPPRPWPVTVAGLPLFLTTSKDQEPLNLGARARGPKINIKGEIIRWKTPEMQTFIEIFEALKGIGAEVERVQWIGWAFLVLAAQEPDKDWKSRLPSTINNIYVGYIFGEVAVTEHALRTKLPTDRDHDDTAYSNLRPGIKLACRTEPEDPKDTDAYIATTAGICVESPGGKKYITLASHGFESTVGSEVRHPSLQGRLLGFVAKNFGETDISLCELNPGVSYSRETFSVADPTAPEVKPFREIIANPAKLLVGDLIIMDTAFNGRCEGNLIKVELQKIPADDPISEKVEYALGSFGYFGNGREKLYDGCCGGVLWNENCDVIGQFRFQETGTEICHFPAFSSLHKWGYKLSET
ncbi:hypothetical protein OEA41_004641 [Lepraria neglecta]|uniref:Uncharacterized protein n=1 Tax=Lepraria neglecta TaxID=209136 RepID=A0AAD9YYZ9_9LECA|nr:hypothetical protein OEA41_004641 [Lepraria neglecta]